MNGKGRGMRQESPPDNVNNRENQFLPEQDFTEDAFLACQGKKEGDSTMVHNDHNETVKATCQIINDHLVAVVKKTTEPEDRRPPLRR